MMNLIKKVKASYFKIHNDFLTVLENDNSPLFIYDLKLFEQIKKIGENYGGGLYIVKNYIFDESFKGIDINTLSEKIFFEKENIFYYIVNNKYGIVRKFIEEFEVEFYLLDIKNFQILQKVDFQGEIVLFSEIGDIISNIDNTLFKYSNFSLLWQKDIRVFFNKEDSKDNQLQIKEIYAYKDNFIVVSTFGILCLNQQNGELIWKTDSYARTMEIVGNFGYVCTGGSLYRVNLDNGEMYNYGKEYARLSDFEYEGKSYWPSGHRVVFHDGLLWYLVYASGDSFVIAIDPENAEYQWIHKIDTYEKADEIQFHQDKMFISDSGGNLFIYEKT